ncbi:MAG: UDP-N-acetylmuramoyl-L-alanine--D-glutamate ligase [bacterium]
MNLEALKHKNIHIVGISGAEGSSVAEFLLGIGARDIIGHDIATHEEFRASYYKYHDWLTDDEKEKKFQSLTGSEIKINFGREYLSGIEKADVVFVPQSWFRYKENIPKLKKMMEKGTPFSSIMKLYFELSKAPIVGITGTVGKSSVASFTYQILSQFKPGHVFATGNDRKNEQVLNKILDLTIDDILVVEISNRQLTIDLQKSPHVGVLTNVSPNHLDDHESFIEYKAIKQSLFQYQTGMNFAVFDYDDEESRDIAKDLESNVIWVSTKEELNDGVYIKNGDIEIKAGNKVFNVGQVRDIAVPGVHNEKNVLLAIASAYALNIDSKTIRESLANLKSLPNRIEEVANINGAKYINDTSSTRPKSMQAAVETFKSYNTILITGGKRPILIPGEFESAADQILDAKVKAVFLIGEAGQQIEDTIRSEAHNLAKNVPLIMKVKNLDEAVDKANRMAKKGDTVLFSPGCESFDMFADYRDRGNKFKELVKKYEKR